MADTQFVVDLGTIKLTEEQRRSMNVAIQSAVAGVLASSSSGNKIALFPLDKYKPGPIIDGIVARDLGAKFNELIR